jgi:hypothetical protein
MEHFMEVLGINWWGIGAFAVGIICLTVLTSPSGLGPK